MRREVGEDVVVCLHHAQNLKCGGGEEIQGGGARVQGR